MSAVSVVSCLQRVATLCMHVMTRVIVERAQFFSAVTHDRSLPGRGLCLMVPNRPLAKAAMWTIGACHGSSAGTSADSSSNGGAGSSAVNRRPEPACVAPLAVCMWRMRVQDTVDGLFRSVLQLLLGTVTLLHARQQRLAYRYQRGETPRGPRPEYHTAPALASQASMMVTEAGN
jgi:hypothetical protein